MPGEVQDVFGYAMHLAQVGDKHPQAKPLKGFGDASVLEVVQYHESDAYRRHLTQQRAAELLGMPQPKLSDLFRGKFRGISQAKMIECLNRLGCDVDIVVRKEGRSVLGQTQVLVVE